MTTSMGQEKQRISERLARLDAEREKLGTQLNELEIAERVLARFGGKAGTTEKRRRAPRAKSIPERTPSLFVGVGTSLSAVDKAGSVSARGIA